MDSSRPRERHRGRTPRQDGSYESETSGRGGQPRATGKRSPGTASRGALWLLSAALAVAVLLYLARSSGWGRAGSSTFGAGLILSRAAAAVELEAALDEDPNLGSCFEQQAMLPGLPAYVCAQLRCLWSEAAASGIDLWTHPLRPLPARAGASACPRPRGGQAPTPAGGAPVVVSFVISMHNGVESTAQALLELFRTAHEAESAEFIVVDDGSTEDLAPLAATAAALRALFGVEVVVLTNPTAQGYGAANTRGIQAARGEFVALANNDMFAAKGWLAAILATFRRRPSAGLVGPMFLGEGGLVQESGGIVFSDGQAAILGRGQPLNHHHNYLRRADYVSGACLAFRRSLFLELGGFDPRYERGYFEDTDFAMAVRAAGREVLVQPLAVVYHQEGGTFGTDVDSALKRRLMRENGARFEEKWRAVLRRSHCPREAGLLRAATRQGTPWLLWLDDVVPEPDRDSGSIRSLHMLEILVEAGYQVTFLPIVQRDPAYEAALRALGVHLIPATPPPQWRLQRGGACMFDAILVARRFTFQSVRAAVDGQCPGAPLIYDTVDLHFLREARGALTHAQLYPSSDGDQGGGQEASAAAPPPSPAVWDFGGMDAAATVAWLDAGSPAARALWGRRDLELGFVGRANLTLVVSHEEVPAIRHYRPDARVAVLSNIHDLPAPLPTTTCEGRSGLLFVGNMLHFPNWQSIEVMVQEVLPRLLALLPAVEAAGLRFHVVGSNPAPPHLVRLFERSAADVTFHGFLSDDELRKLYGRVRAVVAPVLAGAGVKGKVNQAMKMGVPVVATPLAVEGMHARDGVDCLVGGSAEEFASKVAQVYLDCGLWQRLARGGFDNVRSHFSKDVARPVLLQALEGLGVGPRGTISDRSTCHSGS